MIPAYVYVCVCWPLRTTVSLYNFFVPPSRDGFELLALFFFFSVDGWWSTSLRHVQAMSLSLYTTSFAVSKSWGGKSERKREFHDKIWTNLILFLLLLLLARVEMKRKKTNGENTFSLVCLICETTWMLLFFFVCCNLFLGVLVRAVEWPSLSER